MESVTLLTNALAALNVDRMESDLVDLLRFPSVVGTAAEVDVALWLADRWQSEGMSVEIFEHDLAALQAHPDYPGEEVVRSRAVSVVASYDYGPGPHLLLLGHTDVVPIGDESNWVAAPFDPQVTERDGQRIIIGRGTCDMKAGLAAAWEAVRAVHIAGGLGFGKISLVSVCGEEDGGLGTFGLIQAGVRADMCVIPEPTSLAIVPCNAGALTFRLTVRGKAIHASRKAEGVSAFDKFLPVYEALNKFEMDRNSDPDELFARWQYPFAISVGTIQAGEWSSSVPDRLVAEGRLGVKPGETIETAKNSFAQMLHTICQSDEWLAEHPVEIEWPGGMFAPGATQIDDAVVQYVVEAHSNQFGVKPLIYGAPYGSDLRLWSAVGVPTIQYGPGDVTYAHTANEFVDLDETLAAAKTFVQLLVNEFGR
jgi:acetylornithine deacetylase